VLRGRLGFGAGRLYAAGTPQLSTDAPVVIEIVEHGDRIGGFLPALDEMVGDSS
jgi:PII-like signaling protein